MDKTGKEHLGSPHTSALLLWDALEQVAVNPTASYRWHQLTERYLGVTDESCRINGLRYLLNKVPGEGLPGFLRATFLAYVAGQEDFVAAAGRLVQSIEPLDPDRLVSYLTYEWGRTVVSVPDREGFVRSFRQACLPEVASRLGKHLSDAHPGQIASRNITRIARVALVTPFISNSQHTPTNLALHQARALIELGYEVRLFSCQDIQAQGMPHYLSNKGKLLIFPPELEELRHRMHPALEVTLSDDRFSVMRRWLDMLKVIAVFDPDLVMFVGIFSPLVTPLYEVRPVLGLSIHTIPPLAPLDVWLTSQKEQSNRMIELWSPSFPAVWGFHHPYRLGANPGRESVPRAELGIGDQALVLVTAGYRLPHEITGPWAARLVEILKNNTGLVWLLVGGVGHTPSALEGLPAEQLRILPHHAELRGILRNCDIYVNPPRMGGGFSVADAMAEGLPVLSYAHSDGGDKVGDAGLPNDEAYFSRLDAFIRDPVLRHEAGKEMRSLFLQNLDLDKAGPSLAEACNLTLERFKARTRRPVND